MLPCTCLVEGSRPLLRHFKLGTVSTVIELSQGIKTTTRYKSRVATLHHKKRPFGTSSNLNFGKSDAL